MRIGAGLQESYTETKKTVPSWPRRVPHAETTREKEAAALARLGSLTREGKKEKAEAGLGFSDETKRKRPAARLASPARVHKEKRAGG